MAVSQLVGARIHRREDPRLITGRGRYVDDHNRPGQLWLEVVRSPYAHARIVGIDAAEARKAPGVVAVYTAEDIGKVVAGAMPVAPAFTPTHQTEPPRLPLATGEVTFQGEAVAVVIAGERYQAADAVELVDVEYDPLPVVHDIEEAIKPGSPKVHTDLDGPNIAWDIPYTPDVPEVFDAAEVVVKERILQQRLAPTAMEPRGVLADWDPADRAMTMWLSSQNPHFIRLFISGAMGIPETRFRVISPDVGGGFGCKISPYPEDYLVPAASKLLGKPVKWIETRTESLQTTTHGRGQVFDVELAGTSGGKIQGLRVTQYLDAGAYIGTFGGFQACACLVSSGAYDIPKVAARTVGVLTNRVPTDPYRGAGRPEATHLIERLVNVYARKIGADPVEVRRQNFVREFPHPNPFGLVYDSGDYDKSLDKALGIAGYEELRRQQAEGRAQGKYLGIGISTWIELCGFGPSGATAPATGGLSLTESAHVRVFPTGSVAVYVGTHSHGQGHDTTFTQIVADALGVSYDSVELHHGDTNEGPSFGYGTYGSRSLAVGGMSIYKSCQKVVDKATKIAAHLFEADPADISFDGGDFYVKGNPGSRKPFGEVAFAAYGMNLPEGMEMGLEAISYFDPPNLVWPFGAHVSLVEVDPETGGVDLKRYVAVDDCGVVINPMIVEGQLHGGIAQGIAQALFEEVVYDEDGALKTGSMVDYLVPTVNEIPNLEIDRTVTPTPVNELGVKGIGEAGTIASSACIINAICDALAPLGIDHVDMPASPDRLWRTIQEVKAKQAAPAAARGGEA
jgi:carbon-monoxide dehydrogenase large subunit